MAANNITIAGNLGADPELRFTPNGTATLRISVGVSERVRDSESGEWRDGDVTWFTVIAWRDLAEHCAETLTRGNRVIVNGIIKSRKYDTPEGESRTVWEITADEIGPSLRFASAQIKRTERTRSAEPATA